jgi:hypothetical protein
MSRSSERVKFLKDKLHSDFSMGIFDFERYHEILKAIDDFGYNIRIGRYEFLRHYFSALYGLYLNFRPVLSGFDSKDLDERFDAVRGSLETIQSSTNMIKKRKLARELENIHMYLLEVKQLKGLGILMSKDVTPEDRLEALK